MIILRKLISTLLVLFIIYLLIQVSFQFFEKRHDLEYLVKTDQRTFKVEEEYIASSNTEEESYFFTINYQNNNFTFQINTSFYDKNKVIENIKYFENQNYKCLLPIFNGNKILTDVMCYKDSNVYLYNNIKGLNKEIDGFVINLGISELILKNENEKDGIETKEMTVYFNNIPNNHYIGINNYKGLNVISKIVDKALTTILFEQDVYSRKIETIVNNYYIVADYNQKYNFSKFYVINLLNNTNYVIETHKEISFSSYIQGNIGNLIYIYDPENKKQYEINLKTKTVLEVGNENTKIIHYEDNQKKRININELKGEKMYFESNIKTTKSKEYIKIDMVGGEKTGYVYYYKKVKNGYDVYRASKRTQEQKVFLFTIENINNVYYIDNYVYFIEQNKLKYYHDKVGIKTIFKNDELSFNSNINIYIYAK